MFRKIVLGVAAVIVAILVFNTGFWVSPPDGRPRLIAHRGVHQTFDNNGLSRDGCSAERIYPPTTTYLENTLPSMAAAFAAGADIVEFDVHPTTDGQLAVIHDWTVDCRTEGTGVTRELDMATLKSLDVGYGYTADGGQTFPFRGKGVGLMPEFGEAMDAAPPGGRYLINFKSREAREGDMIAERLAAHPEWRDRIWGVYGGDEPTYRTKELLAGDGSPLAAYGTRQVRDCLVQYAALGWSGFMPGPCRNTVVMVPINMTFLAWGWPNLFQQRMAAAGTEVVLLGEFSAGDPGTTGIDDVETLAKVPDGFAGYIWTNRIEVIGPAARARFGT